MALVHSVTIDDTTYPQAYSRITSFRGDKTQAGIFVCTYRDEASRVADEYPVRTWEYWTPRASLTGDIYPLAYEYLKTLPDFDGASNHPVADPADG